MKNTGLGRGLGALLGDAALQESQNDGLWLRVSEIEPNDNQPRKNFDEEALQDLADSIKLHGVLQPLAVRRLPTGYYQIIAGERRWRAARLAGLATVPVIVFEADDRRAMELALIENLQREDLDPIEEAEGYRTLTDVYGLTQEEASVQVGKARSSIANAMRLLSLPGTIQNMVSRGELSGGHARSLMPLEYAHLMETAAKQVARDALSVRQTETLVRKMLAQSAQQKKEPEVNYLAEHEERLSGLFGRRVKIHGGKKKGRVELEFYDPDDLDDLLAKLQQALTNN